MIMRLYAVWGARVIYCGKIKACIVQVDLNHMPRVSGWPYLRILLTAKTCAAYHVKRVRRPCETWILHTFHMDGFYVFTVRRIRFKTPVMQLHAVRKRARYSENCAGLVVRHCLLLPAFACFCPLLPAEQFNNTRASTV